MLATFNITISNTLTILGGEPPTQWGSMVWGEDQWGDTTFLDTTTTKVVGESLSLTPTISTVLSIYQTISESLSFLADMGSEELFGDSNCTWNHVFRGGVTEGEDRPTGSFSETDEAATSFTTSTAPSTSWSES